LPTTTVADCGEIALIARIKRRLAMPPWVVTGPGDDAAVVEPVRGALEVLTTDSQVEGVHFDRRFVPPDAIGHRALAVNLSDLAAMGARPRAALLSLALPGTLELASFDQMIDGLLNLADRYGVSLVGGNLTRTSGPLVLDVTLTGSVPRRRLLTRSGASVGDGVFVTGTVGDAAAGLEHLASEANRTGAPASPETNVQISRYLRPDPRVRAGLLLGRNRAASSCIDLSDGVADGVRQLAGSSGVGITLYAAAIPLSPDLRSRAAAGGDGLELALRGGDDFELLFTSGPRQAGRLRTVQRQIGGLPMTRIGVVTREKDLLIQVGDHTRELPAGYEHFR
jgi:thiamine-monophosphate kinase